jgi:Fe2+ or Zn2+ uptake regulation protein
MVPMNHDEALQRVMLSSHDLTHTRVQVLLALVTGSDANDEVEVPMEYVAAMTGLTPRSVRDHLNSLEHVGILKMTRTPRYKIILPPLPASKADYTAIPLPMGDPEPDEG